MKTALLSNGLIEHLVNSMVVEFEHRIARALYGSNTTHYGFSHRF
jgi:hypothetical protein